MDKNAIKKYAVWARRDLIERVSQRAMIYGITAKDVGDPNAESINGHLLSQKEKRQRQALIRNIKEKGYEQVMEEVAYTWFNRFTALRFMEVNGYLPSHIRVFTNDAGEFKPQILAEAIHLELDGLDMNKVYELESANKGEELFKYLLIVQCNALNSILPGMFQRIDDYTELLLPDYLLREGSVIEQMVTSIPEEDWTDQVQIIGWLYEAYNIELNDIVYNGNMSKSRISKDLLPAATTIYTPDWPVRYMVENSLGRLWLEGHPNDALKSEWKYFLDEAEQELDVQAQLATIRKEYAALKPEEIRVIDPCMGSGHILCVLFDVLVRIYEDYGYTAREAAVKIVENNLWGLDIDERAAQLSYFAVMMKARQYDRRFFTREVQPHVYAIHETNILGGSYKQAMGDFLLSKEHQETLNYLMDVFVDAKEFGSILCLEKRDYQGLKEAWDLTWSQTAKNENMTLWSAAIDPELPHLIEQAITLSQKYHVVVTNPPYLGNSRFSQKLDAYVKANYEDVKSDLCMVMYKHALQSFSKRNGLVAFITTSSWMFLTSFEKIRAYLFQNSTITTLVDYGTELFEGKVGHNPIVSWVTLNNSVDYIMTAIRLVDYCYSRRDEKEPEYFEQHNRFTTHQRGFDKIPGAPVAYWVSDSVLNAFEHGQLSEYAALKQGLATGDNNRFLRFWQEVEFNSISFSSKDREQAVISKKKWFPCNKGGAFRRWYGNRDYLVNWENDGLEIRNNVDEKGKQRSRPQNVDYYFREGMTWSTLSAGLLSMRYSPLGTMFETKGSVCFPKAGINLWYLLGLMNTKVVIEMLRFLSPTLDFHEGPIGKVPVLFSKENEDRITDLVKTCVTACKEDWDSFEASWDFQEHPFITSARRAARTGQAITIKQAYADWQKVADKRFRILKENEEELNSIFIDIYGLDDELTSEVDDKDVTVRRADLKREVRSFISYAVGCMFGRYTLGKPGLIYAGGEWDASAYSQFQPDKDAIIPICDDEYFEDDVVGRFVSFVEAAFGKEVLEQNLRDIADALGGKGSSREIIRSYFINNFYADHLKVYQKRPIYWLFDSGKKNGFKCLIYMHRYQPDTIARIRTDYVHEQQSRYRTAIADMEQRINGASTSERVKLNKQLNKLRAQAEETRVYEEKIHHLADQMIKIDLDDGVKHNYAIFKDVLAKIK